ncbi:hypothetical protein BC834DRAFT_355433 [Gloeopeniophorella convolvens]|nr:hypothetical protein BC834DRAFT_355433 [Gloeopeniophorella convolvens]
MTRRLRQTLSAPSEASLGPTHCGLRPRRRRLTARNDLDHPHRTPLSRPFRVVLPSNEPHRTRENIS